MEFTVKKKNKLGLLNISGEFTIQDLDDSKERLIEAQESVEELVLYMDDVTVIDTAAVQLLYAVHLNAVKQNKKLTMNGDCPAVLKEVLEGCGFHHYSWLCFDNN